MIRTPVREIVRAVDDAATEWSDSRSTRRADARAAVAARTGYSLAAVEYAFDRLFGTLRRDALESIITEELGALDALDGFAELAARPRARALPIGRVCIVSSRTTIGVALIPAIFALCAKCDVHVKDREDGLVAAFFASLSERLPALDGAFTARAWTSAEESGELGSFDAVVAFGSDATIAAVASGLPPSTRFLPFGSKASAGYVTRESLTTPAAAAAIARGAATDLVLYDTEGCLSLHALFVEEGGDVTADAFAHLLAEAIEDAGERLAPAGLDPFSTAQRAMARDVAVFGNAREVYCGSRGGFLAVLDAPFDELPLLLPRSIGIRRVDAPTQAAAYLRHHGLALEALAVAGTRPDVVDFGLASGASRIAPFGSLQAPPLRAFHGGRRRIADFVRWIGDES